MKLWKCHCFVDALLTNDLLLNSQALQAPDSGVDAARLSVHTELGSAIRQLINSRSVHRVSLAVMRLNGGRKQFLVSGHEKNRLTVLSMNALLRGVAATPVPAPVSRTSSNNSGVASTMSQKKMKVRVLVSLEII